jgi:hypothetical protein
MIEVIVLYVALNEEWGVDGCAREEDICLRR